MKRKIISILILMALCLNLAVCVSASYFDIVSEDDSLVYDGAGLLSQSEEKNLDAKLKSISQAYNAEIRVVVLSSSNGSDVDELLEYLYDGLGMGYGTNHDGVLLLVCMDPREYRILSNGFAGDAITPDDIEMIGDVIVSDLSGGKYYDAFNAFAQECQYYLDGYINGFPFDAGSTFVVSAVLGLLVAWIVTAVMKGQLKSVQMQRAASAYVKYGSLEITQSGDFFMYRNITRTERPQNNSSSRSGGGGSSRSTGGGSF